MALIKLAQKTYANVLADGKIRIASNEANPDAVRRDYELKDGTKGFKYEEVFDKINGLIKGIMIYEGDYGKTLQITINDGDDIVLCLNMSSNFAEDFMKKLPNINLEKSLELSPYSFETDAGKIKKGITITQDGNKLKNFFYNEEKKENILGYPTAKVPKKGWDSDDWKVYFVGCRKFLQEYMEANIYPKLPKMSDLGGGLSDADIAEDLKNIKFAKKDEMPASFLE